MLANETTSTARRPKKSKPAVKPLPPKGRVRLSQILAAGFFGRASFHEKIAGGFFPEADKLGSMSTWNVEHVGNSRRPEFAHQAPVVVEGGACRGAA